jgi:hypothetical protein
MENNHTNATDAAFAKSAFYHEAGGVDSPQTGLTKREYFAAMAMQGLLHNYNLNGMYGNSPSYPIVHEQAVIVADALIEQLNK